MLDFGPTVFQNSNITEVKAIKIFEQYLLGGSFLGDTSGPFIKREDKPDEIEYSKSGVYS